MITSFIINDKGYLHPDSEKDRADEGTSSVRIDVGVAELASPAILD
jgi:hypothetical protein